VLSALYIIVDFTIKYVVDYRHRLKPRSLHRYLIDDVIEKTVVAEVGIKVEIPVKMVAVHLQVGNKPRQRQAGNPLCNRPGSGIQNDTDNHATAFNENLQKVRSRVCIGKQDVDRIFK